MAMRITGLMSGMDTDSIIQELVAVKRAKVDDAKKAQTKLQWKQDSWKSLNTQLMKLYNGTLSNMRFESSYMKKTTKVSNSNVVSVITGEGAMNSVQSLKVSEMAQSGYLTGSKLGDGQQGYTSSATLGDLGMAEGENASFQVTVGDQTTNVNVNSSTTIANVVKSLQDAGLNASFDEKNQRIFVSSKESGTANDFTITADDAKGMTALQNLGLGYVDDAVREQYTKLANGNTAEYIAEKQQEELTKILDKRTELQNERTNQVQKLWDGYSADLLSKGIDLTDADISNMTDAEYNQLTTAVSEIYSEKSGEEGYADLENWSSNLNGITTELSGIADKLTIENGNEVLTDEIMSKIEQEIKDIATQAQSFLDNATAKKSAGADAVISLNGEKYTSNSNTFEINGLTLTVNATTAENETVTITTQDDTDGIYDMVKGFIKEYNELINQMDKLYNADSSKGYEPLSSEDKEAMSDDEIEEWEGKIKDSLLRKDGTLGTLSSAMKEIMMSGVDVNGKKMYLSDFGIETLSYFTAADNEKNAYHINGDEDDENTSGNPDKLRTAVANNPEEIMNFFTGLSQKLYGKLTDLTGMTEYSTKYVAYDDKKMKKDYDNYTAQIKELEAKLTDYEDKWYAKFAAMETAMAKMQSNASAVTSLLGGG